MGNRNINKIRNCCTRKRKRKVKRHAGMFGMSSHTNADRCHVEGCLSLRSDEGISFFSVYSDLANKFKVWASRIGLKDTSVKRISICEKHFESHVIQTINSKRRLFANALPTLNLPNQKQVINSPVEQTIARETQAKEINLKEKQVKQRNVRKITMEEKIRQGAPIEHLHTAQVIQRYRERIRQCDSHVIDKLSLRMYIEMPENYHIFKSALELSSFEVVKSTALGICDNVNRKDFYSLLKNKFSKASVEQKKCVLCVAEFDVRPKLYYNIQRDTILGIHDTGQFINNKIASKAIFIYLQGILSKWQQPIIVLYRDEIVPERNLKDMCYSLAGCGLIIVAVVLKPDGQYTKNKINLPITIEKVVDPKSWFACFYEKFRHIYVEDGEVIIRRKFISNYAEVCAEHNIPIKVDTQDSLPKDINTRLELFLQNFSPETTSTMSCLIERGLMSKSASSIFKMNFAVTNMVNILCPSLSRDRRVFNKLYPTKEAKLNVVEAILDYSSGLQTTDPTREELLTQVIASLKFIQHLNTQLDKDQFITNDRINLDYGNDLINRIPKRKDDPRPSVQEIDTVFRRALLHNLLKPLKTNKSLTYEENLYAIQNLIYKVINEKRNDVNHDVYMIAMKNIKIPRTEYMHDNIPIDSRSFSKYLLGKCIKYHECECIKKYPIPEDVFEEFITKLDTIFVSYFQSNGFTSKRGRILEGLLKLMQTNRCCPCVCFPTDYLKKLFLRCRIFSVLKQQNKSNSELVVTPLIVV